MSNSTATADVAVVNVLTLTANDRCIRCSAQAYTGWVQDPTDDPLLWCAHHDREHAEALEATGWVRVIDERHKLTIERESSADV